MTITEQETHDRLVYALRMNEELRAEYSRLKETTEGLRRDLEAIRLLASQVCASAARDVNYTEDVLRVDAPALRRLRMAGAGAGEGREG